MTTKEAEVAEVIEGFIRLPKVRVDIHMYYNSKNPTNPEKSFLWLVAGSITETGVIPYKIRFSEEVDYEHVVKHGVKVLKRHAKRFLDYLTRLSEYK